MILNIYLDFSFLGVNTKLNAWATNSMVEIPAGGTYTIENGSSGGNLLLISLSALSTGSDLWMFEYGILTPSRIFGTLQQISTGTSTYIQLTRLQGDRYKSPCIVNHHTSPIKVWLLNIAVTTS